MFNSLRFRLTLISIGLAVGPLILVGAIIGQRSFTSLEQQSLALQREVTARVGSEIRAFIEGRENELVLLDKVYGLGIREREEQRTILNNMLLYQQIYQEVVLLNSEGQEQIRLSRSDVILDDDLESRAENEEFLFPAKRRGTYFGPVHFDETVREPLLTISVPLFDRRSGEVVSVLVADLRFKTIWNLLADIELPSEGDVYVINQAGQVVAHRNPAIVLRGTTLEPPEADGRAEGLSGTDVIVARDILRFGDQEFVVVAEQPVSKALELATNSLRVAVVITSAAFVLAVVLVVLTTRQIVKPIEALATSARAISSGDFSLQVEVSGRDEVGQLASTFNQMVSDLKESHEKVRRYTQELELKVEERTAELKTINEQLQRDIAERKRAEEQIEASLKEKEVLLKEIHHRVKNNLQVISSLLALQANYVEDQKVIEVFQDSQNRVHSMALVHEKLYQSRNLARIDFAEYIQNLATYLFRSYGVSTGTIALKTQTDEVFLEINTAIPCGLILNELISNALKHAFPGGRKGGIRIELGAAGDDQWRLIVADNGCGLPEELDLRHTTSLGLKLVNTLVKQLKGTMAIHNQEGAEFKITFAAT